MLKCHGIYYSTCYACSKYLVRAVEEDSGPWEEGANDPATRKEKDKWGLPTLTVAERLPFFFSSASENQWSRRERERIGCPKLQLSVEGAPYKKTKSIFIILYLI